MNTDFESMLRHLFFYREGYVYYRVNRGKKKAGELAGSKVTGFPYRRLSVNRKKFLEHRVIYFLCKGVWPKMVDHINRNKLDNRIENLRAATSSQNAFNKKVKSVGARLHSCGRWESYAAESGLFKHLGYYSCQTAAMVYSSLYKQKASGGFYDPFS